MQEQEEGDTDLLQALFKLNWNVVWWHFFSLCWLAFAVILLGKNKVRKLIVFILFSGMSAIVALFTAQLGDQDEPSLSYSLVLFAFSLVLLGIIYFNKVAENQPFGPLIFRLFLFLQFCSVLEALCKYQDSFIIQRPYEGEVEAIKMQYRQRDKDLPVDGTYKMHITCYGTGNTLVILEPGMPFNSASLSGVAQRIAARYENTTACTYDRLGYAWSEPSRNQRNTVNMVNELRSWMFHKNLTGKPTVFVGWSFGGLIGQLYFRLFPHDMIGLILIDSMDCYSWKDDPMLWEDVETGIASFTIAKIITPIGLMRFVGFLGQLPPECGFPAFDTLLPTDSVDAMRAVFFHDKMHFNIAHDELAALRQAVNQSYELLTTPISKNSQYNIENLPIIMLSSGIDVPPNYPKSYKRLKRMYPHAVDLSIDYVDIPMYDPEAIVDSLQAVFIVRSRN